MENELYVVWLTRTSGRARAAVAEVVGDFAMEDLLDRVARFGRTPEGMARLAARIRAAFTPPRLPAVFTDRHLRQLVEPRVQPVLAEVLACPPSDVSAALFDSGRLAQALREAGHAKAGIHDAELLLLELLPRLPRLAARHGLEAHDWGGHLESRSWLTSYAVGRLTATAQRREWPADASPTQLLAGVLEGVGGRPEAEEVFQFDTLALIEIRRRLGLLAEQLRSDAREHATEAAHLETGLTSVVRLPAWIDLYESDAVAEGLRRLFTGATSVGDLLGGAYTTPPAVTGEPEPDEGLRITNEIAFGVVKRRVAFDVGCAVQGERQQQVILRCRGLRRSELDVVKHALQELRGKDLSTEGGTLGERLLNTQVARRSGLKGYVRLALHRHGPEVAQCVVLTGTRRPVEVPAPWHEHLDTVLPYASPPQGDTRFPPLAEVVRELRAGVAPGRRIEEVE